MSTRVTGRQVDRLTVDLEIFLCQVSTRVTGRQVDSWINLIINMQLSIRVDGSTGRRLLNYVCKNFSINCLLG